MKFKLAAAAGRRPPPLCPGRRRPGAARRLSLLCDWPTGGRAGPAGPVSGGRPGPGAMAAGCRRRGTAAGAAAAAVQVRRPCHTGPVLVVLSR